MTKSKQDEQDMEEERAMADELSRLWHQRLQKLPRNYHIDYAMMQGDSIVGFAEMRRRHHDYGRYPTCMVSLKKWMGMQEVTRRTQIPVYFVVKYDSEDAPRIVTVDDTVYGLKLGGNLARGYEDGIEPVVHIPIEKLQQVKPMLWLERMKMESLAVPANDRKALLA